MMRFQGNLKIAAIAALGVMLLAVIAGAIVFALTALQDTTEDTPAAIVGETASSAVSPVQTVGSVASSPLEPEPAEASANPPSEPFDVSAARDGFSVIGSWSAATGATSYDVELRKWTANAITSLQTKTGVTGTTTSFALPSVAAFHDSHIVYATAKNSAGSTDIYGSSVVGPPAAPDSPASVTGARSESGNSVSIAATWSQVTNITSYGLRYKADGEAWKTWATGVSTNTNTATITGLEKKKAYIVSANTERTYTGSGNLSTTLTGDWKDSGKIHAPPGSPRDLSHTISPTGTNSHSVTVQWTIPEFTGTGSNEAANEIKYDVSCRVGSNAWVQLKSNTKFPIISNNPAKYKVTLYDLSCQGASSQVAIAAINEIKGPSAVHSLN